MSGGTRVGEIFISDRVSDASRKEGRGGEDATAYGTHNRLRIYNKVHTNTPYYPGRSSARILYSVLQLIYLTGVSGIPPAALFPWHFSHPESEA